MSFLHYDALKNETKWSINLKLEVAEYFGQDLRKALKNNESAEMVGEIYATMEKTVSLLYLSKREMCETYVNQLQIDESFKKEIIEDFQSFQIKQIKTGDSIFVKPNFLDMFLSYIFPYIKVKIVLYTGSSDYSIDKKHIKYLNNNKIVKWYAHNALIQHEKLIKIPIGFSKKIGENKETIENLIKKRKDYNDKEDDLLITYMEITNENRENIKHLENKSWITKINKMRFDIYINNINNYKFVLCPIGNGVDTFRFWETVFMGSIPVIESCKLNDLYEKVNCLVVNSFEDLSKKDLENYEKKYENLDLNECLKLKKYAK